MNQEIIKCTQCKKKFFPDGFKISRLGVRNRTCLECGQRRKAAAERRSTHDHIGSIPLLLREAIIQNSESNQYDIARLEWDYDRVEVDDEYTVCECGVRILERCYVKNRINANELLIGNICIKNFINQDIGDCASKISNSLNKIKKNPITRARMPYLIDDALKRGRISDWDERFLISLQGTRKELSVRQMDKLGEINNKMLDAYKSTKLVTD
mmetsp:Transcript_33820/g.39766  ORF Transcript_33820/g.39766 Transcript_33820/m.39766 type:complete len:212 (-) Transcript_33820:129-764(-)